MNKPISELADYSGISRKGLIWTVIMAALLPLVFYEDGLIRNIAKDLRVPVLFRLMHILTWIGKGWVLMAAAAILYGIGYRKKEKKLKRAGARGLIALVVSGTVVQVVKHVAGRPRPALLDEGISQWGLSLVSGHDSFPSGHAISAFAMAAVLSAFYPGGRWIWYALAVLVAFTRIYIDAHFASDVFIGAVLGVLIGAWVSRLKLERLKS